MLRKNCGGSRMKTIAFFDVKPYDRDSFERANRNYEIRWYESRLTPQTAALAAGSDAVCAFVNDEISAETIERLDRLGVKVIAMRCAGYSNVDLNAAAGKMTILRVPAYSPEGVAEHAMALLLAVNRRLHRAYDRTRDFNFNISGLTGLVLSGKTVGVIGTGKIGRRFIDICRGFGMHVLAYDPYPVMNADFEYVALDRLLAESDVISLHCPLTAESYHLLNREAFRQMKDGVFIINTSRGALIDSQALLDALNDGKVRGAGLDVYEEESGYFYEDRSNAPIQDNTLALLISRPNVLITSHQAFLTEEALENIAETSFENLDAFFEGRKLENEVRARRETAHLQMSASPV